MAQLKTLPAPFADVGGFLDAVAGGGAVPVVPPELPAAVAEILEKLGDAV